MKITEHIPPPPPVTTYTLDLTSEQLVGLGVLSYSHESIVRDGDTFFRSLPKHVQRKVESAAGATKTTAGSSKLGIDWSA